MALTLAAYVEKHGLSEASRRLKVPRMTLWRWIRKPEKISPVLVEYLRLKGIKP